MVTGVCCSMIFVFVEFGILIIVSLSKRCALCLNFFSYCNSNLMNNFPFHADIDIPDGEDNLHITRRIVFDTSVECEFYVIGSECRRIGESLGRLTI